MGSFSRSLRRRLEPAFRRQYASPPPGSIADLSRRLAGIGALPARERGVLAWLRRVLYLPVPTPLDLGAERRARWEAAIFPRLEHAYKQRSPLLEAIQNARDPRGLRVVRNEAGEIVDFERPLLRETHPNGRTMTINLNDDREDDDAPCDES